MSRIAIISGEHERARQRDAWTGCASPPIELPHGKWFLALGQPDPFKSACTLRSPALKKLEMKSRSPVSGHRRPSDPQLAARRSALLELAARHRMLRTAIAAVSDQTQELAQLPRLVLSSGQDEPRVAAVARLYPRAVDGTFSAPTFQEFIQAVADA